MPAYATDDGLVESAGEVGAGFFLEYGGLGFDPLEAFGWVGHVFAPFGQAGKW